MNGIIETETLILAGRTPPDELLGATESYLRRAYEHYSALRDPNGVPKAAPPRAHPGGQGGHGGPPAALRIIPSEEK